MSVRYRWWRWRLYCLFDYFLFQRLCLRQLANANGVFPSNRVPVVVALKADELLVVEVAVNNRLYSVLCWLSGNSLVHFSAPVGAQFRGVRALLF